MKRHPQWDQRLHDCVTANLNKPYEFGRHDCLLWPAAAVRAVTGKDYGRGHRGKYDSIAKAYRYLQGLGFSGPEAFLDSLFDEKPVGFAGRGDLVLCHVDLAETQQGILPGDVPGVCMGDFALIPGENGLLRLPRERWLKAWAVGDHHSSWPDE